MISTLKPNAKILIGNNVGLSGVVICSSLNQFGFDNVWKYILKFIDIRKKNNDFINERNLQKINRMWGLVDLKVKGFVKNISSRKFVQELLKNVKTNNLSMYRAVKMISNCIIKK